MDNPTKDETTMRTLIITLGISDVDDTSTDPLVMAEQLIGTNDTTLGITIESFEAEWEES